MVFANNFAEPEFKSLYRLYVLTFEKRFKPMRFLASKTFLQRRSTSACDMRPDFKASFIA